MRGGGTSRSRAAAAFALVLTLNAVSAHADPSASQIATAKSLVAEGRKQRASGDHAAAKQKFKAAWALVPTPIIGLDLAKEHVALGELVEAREVCLEIARIAPSAKESAESQAARAEAKALEESLKPRIPTLTIEVVGVPAGITVSPLLDDDVVPLEALGIAQKVNPGKHAVIAKAGGRSRRQEITVTEGKSGTVRLDFSGETFASVATNSASRATIGVSGAKPAASDSGISTGTYILFGTAVGATLLGVGLAVAWARNNAKLDDCRRQVTCKTSEDIQKIEDEREWRQWPLGLGTVAAFALGAGLAYGGVVSLRDRSTARVAVGFTGSGAWLRAEF